MPHPSRLSIAQRHPRAPRQSVCMINRLPILRVGTSLQWQDLRPAHRNSQKPLYTFINLSGFESDHRQYDYFVEFR